MLNKTCSANFALCFAVRFLYYAESGSKEEEEEADRLEEEAKTKESAKAKEAAKEKKEKESGPASPSKGNTNKATKNADKVKASPAKEKRKREDEPPLVEEIFPVGANVVVYAGSQTDHPPLKKEARPNKGEMVTNSGRLKGNVALFRGVVVANQAEDMVPNHVLDGGDFPLTEGLIGIKVRTPFNTCSIYVQYASNMLHIY